MLPDHLYQYIRNAILCRPIWYPIVRPYPLDDVHEPILFQCQVTANHLEVTKGWGAQIGIQWIVRFNKLLPWVHVVNWRDGVLVDYSHPILERRVGFTPMGNDVDIANQITCALQDIETTHVGRPWADPYLQQLHEDWLDHFLSKLPNA